jgi:hypothetical protein
VVIAVLAYASVGLAVEDRVPDGTLGYGAGLAVLFLVAHLAVRRFAPYADPLILPCVALLNGLGLVMIRRLDFSAAERAQQLARELPRAEAPRQLVWTAVGIVGFVLVLVVVRDHTKLQRYTYTAAAAGLVLLLLPALPVLGQTINGARLWIRVGPFTLQPSELAKLLLILFFAGYLVAKRDVLSLASRRVLGLDLPRARDLGPGAHRVGGQPRGARARQGPRQLAAVLRDLRGDALHRHRAHQLAAHRPRPVRRRGARRLPAVRPRAAARRHLARPVRRPGQAGFQLVQSLFGFGTGG